MTDGKHSGYKNSTGVGAVQDYGAGYTSTGWVMQPTNYASDSQVALEVSPDNSTWTRIGISVGGNAVLVQAGPIAARYARINVVAVGTSPPGGNVGGVISPAA